MSPASKRSPPSASGRARASIASERSMPSVSPAASSWWRRAVSSPVPHPRSTTRMPGRGRTSASRSRNGRARSSRKRSYCAGSQASRVMQDELPIRCPDRLQTPPMRASDAANRPRWNGQAGFFEIWFLVVFEAAARRAWWFRYTTFAPAPGLQPGVARATLWAAAFDARAPEPAIAVKHILGPEGYHAGSPERFAIRVGAGELRNDVCRGEVESGGHRIAWALRFAPAAREARRAAPGADLVSHRPQRARSVRTRVARGEPGRGARPRAPRVPLHLRDPLAARRGVVRSAHPRRLRLPRPGGLGRPRGAERRRLGDARAPPPPPSPGRLAPAAPAHVQRGRGARAPRARASARGALPRLGRHGVLIRAPAKKLRGRNLCSGTVEPHHEEDPEDEIARPHQGSTYRQRADGPEPHEQRKERQLAERRDRDEETVGTTRRRGPQIAEPEEQHEHGDGREVERVLTRRESRDCPQDAGGRSKESAADDVHPGGGEQRASHPGRQCRHVSSPPGAPRAPDDSPGRPRARVRQRGGEERPHTRQTRRAPPQARPTRA